MTPSALYARFRSDVVDAVAPFFWTVDEVWGYMTDAQEKFCRLTDGLRDATSEAAQAQITTGEAFVDLHPAVLSIRGVTLDSTGERIHLYSYEEVAGTNDLPLAQFTQLELDTAGVITGAIVGMEEGKLRLTSVPEEDDLLNLVVERLPLIAPSGVGPLEIRAEHHLALLLWMKHLAYAKDDAEVNDKVKSADYEARFERYCRGAKHEKQRRDHKPRLIAYGGI